MIKMSGQEIRERFVAFFQKCGHQKINSSPLIPQNDPTLLFANAGMNQFKDYFTGVAKAKNKRAVTIQKCVRAGGKHNDLDNVGFTARHHTFFEMLGNFSFGDYFKEDAIKLAWKFLTNELKIPSEKLYITVHDDDDESLNIWHHKIGVPLHKIFKKGDKDNFWEMGEFGPCGPCSEIFYDHGEIYADKNLVGKNLNDLLQDELRYVEIWNLVFMQFEKTPEGRIALPTPSIDTGAGLERLAAVMQGVYWNYDTDLFTPIIKKIEELSQKKYSDNRYTASMRVVADHIRSSTMLISDGVIPSNEGRGYVLRRIIRRAVRHLKELEMAPLSFQKLVPPVFEVLGLEYPQNEANKNLVVKFLELEEKKFLETLEQGIKFLQDALTDDIKDSTLQGESAFKLYDTYGFPLDLTQIICSEKGLNVDTERFDEIMRNRREESKKTWKTRQTSNEKNYHKAKEKFGATMFSGYSQNIQEAKLLEIIDEGDEKNEKQALIFDKTCFYGESGGQAGDTGGVYIGDTLITKIIDTQKPVEGLFAHFTDNAEALQIGSNYTLKIDKQKRELTKRNHTATHLLQAALTQVLGDHIKQAGSSVNHEKLRFDFTHHQALTRDELLQLENIVNEQIMAATKVEANTMSMTEAQKKGALAFFGDKYGDEVRVLTVGNFSIELCGGTHVTNTREIGYFSILSESSLSSGVRRIEAITSDSAIEKLNHRSKILKQLELMLKDKEEKIVKKIEILLEEVKIKDKEISRLCDKIESYNSKELFNDTHDIGGHQLTYAHAQAESDLKKIADIYSNKFPSGILFITAPAQDKFQVLIKAPLKSPPEKASVDAGKILKATLPFANGRGGGKPNIAQGTGEINLLQVFKQKTLEEIHKVLTQET